MGGREPQPMGRGRTDGDPAHDVTVDGGGSASLTVPVGDPAASQIIGGEFDDYPVAGEDADVVLAHLPGKVTEHLVAVLELDHEHRVRQGFMDTTIDVDGVGILPARTLLGWRSSGGERAALGWTSTPIVRWLRQGQPPVAILIRDGQDARGAWPDRMERIVRTLIRGLRSITVISSRSGAGNMGNGQNRNTAAPRYLLDDQRHPADAQGDSASQGACKYNRGRLPRRAGLMAGRRDEDQSETTRESSLLPWQDPCNTPVANTLTDA